LNVKGRVTQKVFIEVLKKPPFLYLDGVLVNVGILGDAAVK